MIRRADRLLVREFQHRGTSTTSLFWNPTVYGSWRNSQIHPAIGPVKPKRPNTWTTARAWTMPAMVPRSKKENYFGHLLSRRYRMWSPTCFPSAIATSAVPRKLPPPGTA